MFKKVLKAKGRKPNDEKHQENAAPTMRYEKNSS